MDTASIHRVYDIITGVGARLCFLPPYSPDLMPLEEDFSKVKYFLKENDNGYLATSQPETFVKIDNHMTSYFESCTKRLYRNGGRNCTGAKSVHC